MFRRKEEETAPQTETKAAAPAAVVEAPAPVAAAPKVEAAPAPVAAAPAPAAAPVAPRPAAPAPVADAKVAPIASAYRPATPAPAPAAARPAMATPAAANMEDKSKRRVLTVGNDILLKGEIATCDRLVIEGAVDAKLSDVHTVEIAQCGSFRGSAEIEDAEISGLFEGDLVVRNRLIIYSTGKVRGKITYGEIEIERGGEMTGEIKMIGQADAVKSKENKSKAA